MQKELITQLENAARKAGQIILSASDIERKTSEKEGHGNFVTEYDRKVQKYLSSELRKILPEAYFLGEEEGEDQFREEYRQGYLFIVDPIDGTANFLSGFRTSVVSIALFRDGKPWIGVIYNPYEDAMFSAERDCGAYKNGSSIRSLDHDLAHSLVLFGTAPYYEDKYELTFVLARKYMQLGMDIRRFGAAAWDLCCLADGRAGLFFEAKLSLWDFAAGALIAEEAGCKITDLDGHPLSFDGPSSVLAASRGVAAEGNYLPREVPGI